EESKRISTPSQKSVRFLQETDARLPGKNVYGFFAALRMTTRRECNQKQKGCDDRTLFAYRNAFAYAAAVLASAAFACSTRAVKPGASFTAISARTLRSSSTPA